MSFDPLDTHTIATHIAEARARGDFAEADRLVALFNERLSPKVPEEPVTPLEKVVENEVSQPIETAREDLLQGFKSNARSIQSYPESVQGKLYDLLDEAAALAQVPRVVLEPQFVEELDLIISEKLEEEPLLQRLSEEAQIRSIVGRYKDDLINTLRERNL